MKNTFNSIIIGRLALVIILIDKLFSKLVLAVGSLSKVDQTIFLWPGILGRYQLLEGWVHADLR